MSHSGRGGKHPPLKTKSSRVALFIFGGPGFRNVPQKPGRQTPQNKKLQGQTLNVLGVWSQLCPATAEAGEANPPKMKSVTIKMFNFGVLVFGSVPQRLGRQTSPPKRV